MCGTWGVEITPGRYSINITVAVNIRNFIASYGIVNKKITFVPEIKRQII